MKSQAPNTNNPIITIWVLKATCFFWLIAKLISWKVWLADRLFPLVPPVSFLEAPGWLHLLFFVTSLALLLFLVVKPATKITLSSLLIVDLAACLFDQTRWQPWEYQYLLTITLFIVCFKRKDLLIAGLAFILIATYFYSGLSKINSGFTFNIWYKMIVTRWLHVPHSIASGHWIIGSGYLLAVIETGAACLLMFRKTRVVGALVLIIMHLFNLLFLGPFGLATNHVVWPWNVLMACLLYLLFIERRKVEYLPSLLLSKKLLWLTILIGVMPATRFVGIWDDYFSAAIYTGNTIDMEACVNLNVDSMPPMELRPYVYKTNGLPTCKNAKVLSVTHWSLMELKVPVYPEHRVFLAIEKLLTTKYGNNITAYKIYKRGVAYRLLSSH